MGIVAHIALLILAPILLNGNPMQEGSSLLFREDFDRGRQLLENLNSGDRADHIGFNYSKEIVPRAKEDTRNGHRTRRWPNGIIPYEISSLYNSNERAIIAAAIEEYHTKTCIRFVNHGNEVDLIHITPDDGMGDQISPYCYSYVGKIENRQFVKMYGECVRLPAMIHELGHVIGFEEHEHNRVDRDSYINIQWNNIDPVYFYAFDKVNDREYDTFGLAYDYYSIMHYPDYSFAKPGLKSFTLKFPGDISRENLRL